MARRLSTVEHWEQRYLSRVYSGKTKPRRCSPDGVLDVPQEPDMLRLAKALREADVLIATQWPDVWAELQRRRRG